jgi:hypothetical protein
LHAGARLAQELKPSSFPGCAYVFANCKSGTQKIGCWGTNNFIIILPDKAHRKFVAT